MTARRELDVREVGRLKAQWTRQGSPRCEHDDTAPETYRGEPTGFVACMACGRFWRPGRPT